MDKKPKKFAIIVAGGTGSRMQSTLPKQYLLLENLPVLMYSIRAFHEHDPQTHIIVTVSDKMLGHWQNLCLQHRFDIDHEVVLGGRFRMESVYNALSHIVHEHPILYKDSLIAVHDGARPLIRVPDIDRLYTIAMQEKCAVPAIPSTNSIRIGTKNKNEVIDRDLVWQIQTPQVFNGNLLISAYRSAMENGDPEKYTDDASVVEEMGNTIHLLAGDYRNIKITYPEDMSIALIYINAQRIS